jgi:hypothetical protein
MFRGLEDRIKPCLQWPIDFGETYSFKDKETSAVKDMLNLKEKNEKEHFLNID